MHSKPAKQLVTAEDPQLTARQQEILALLTAGKANKEIAYQLGIGLGTVKQHMVALFKKLNVSNRAMAVSRGMSLPEAGAGQALPRPSAGDLEWRPAIVLSVSLDSADADSGDGDGQAWRALQRVLVTVAGDFSATIVARPGAGGDLLFGVQRVHEDDAVRAVRAALAAARDLAAAGPEPIRAGIAAGFLLASMQRHGGWTGEMVAGRVVGQARGLCAEAAPGMLALSAAARRLLAFSTRAGGQDWPERLPLLTLALPPPRPGGLAPRLHGRQGELGELRRRLGDLAYGRGAVVVVEGEVGMGKTALARAFSRACADAGVARLEYNLELGDEALPDLTAPALVSGPVAVLVDDVHRAGAAALDRLAQLAARCAAEPILLVALGRPHRPPVLAAEPAALRLRLGRLEPREIQGVMADLDKEGLVAAATRTAVARLASGVPLFAVELVREAQRRVRAGTAPGDELPLPLTLFALVLSRLDSLGLDRTLLRLAAPAERTSHAALAAEWPHPPDDLARALARAEQSGVLVPAPDHPGAVSFNHPLVRAVLAQAMAHDPAPQMGRLAYPADVE